MFSLMQPRCISPPLQTLRRSHFSSSAQSLHVLCLGPTPSELWTFGGVARHFACLPVFRIADHSGRCESPVQDGEITIRLKRIMVGPAEGDKIKGIRTFKKRRIKGLRVRPINPQRV